MSCTICQLFLNNTLYVCTYLGVLLTHSNLNAQINCLKIAWNCTNKDVILHALPLHHIHGIVNALMCPLHSGARYYCANAYTFLKTDFLYL